MSLEPTPQQPFPYRMETVKAALHSDGCFWVANLYRTGDGSPTTPVGSIEQDGRGGADRVYFLGETRHSEFLLWHQALKDSFGGNEEDATFWLMIQEDNEAEVKS